MYIEKYLHFIQCGMKTHHITNMVLTIPPVPVPLFQHSSHQELESIFPPMNVGWSCPITFCDLEDVEETMGRLQG